MVDQSTTATSPSTSLRASTWAAKATASVAPSVASTSAPARAAITLGSASPQPSSSTVVPAGGGSSYSAPASPTPDGHGRAQYGTGRPAPPSSWRSCSQLDGQTKYAWPTRRTLMSSSAGGSSDTGTPRSAASCSASEVRRAMSGSVSWHYTS